MNASIRIAIASLVPFLVTACNPDKNTSSEGQTASQATPDAQRPTAPSPSSSIANESDALSGSLPAGQTDAQTEPPTAPQLSSQPAAQSADQPAPLPAQTQNNAPGQFDYYVLALSWSPEYCNSHPQDSQQCGAKRYGFVLHGLWPQYEKGYPQSCSKQALPQDVKDQYEGLYPNENLMDHEWAKHGTCSGLSPAGYLELSKRTKEQFAIPARYEAPADPFRTTTNEVRAEFVAANPGIPADSISMTCTGSGQYLQELRICHDKAGSIKSCSAAVTAQTTKSCGRPDFLVRSIR
jgi:ribonuclease T2